MAWLVRGSDKALALIRGELDQDAFAEACEQGQARTADESIVLDLTAIDEAD
jgi:hypothetical protein